MSKALLVILDGYGIAENPKVSAVDAANTPCFDSLISQYPHSTLSASGKDVGLPDGQFGNSEVGHLNIGAGRIVWQELSRINNSISEGEFFENEVLKTAFEKAREKGKIHFMGLFSDGGVHSHNEHLYALLEMAKKHNIENAFVHAFTDGRDTSPNGGATYLKEFEAKADEIGTGSVASVIGRYFAMDRDNRWERTQKAYDLLIHGKGAKVKHASEAFENSYKNNVTDEFIEPHIIDDDAESRIEKNDVVIFFNIRGDRARQITRAFFNIGEIPFDTEELDLHYVTFTSYDDTFNPYVKVAFPPTRMKNTLGEYISSKNMKQLRVAETEKYPHVTYFFNGGIEEANPGEERVMIPSPKVATYDLQPEMSAQEVGDTIVDNVKKDFNLIVVNFANPDMVGHTGVFEAAVKAVETVDHQLQRVVDEAKENNFDILIIADHGNADQMKNPDGSAHTAHTSVPVPVILVTENDVKLSSGKLADVAPTLLKILGLNQPEEMTGKALY